MSELATDKAFDSPSQGLQPSNIVNENDSPPQGSQSHVEGTLAAPVAIAEDCHDEDPCHKLDEDCCRLCKRLPRASTKFRSQLRIVESPTFKWDLSKVTKLIPRSKYFRGSGDRRDVRFFLFDLEFAVRLHSREVTNETMHSILLNTTTDDAYVFLLGLSSWDSYAKWVDELISAFSIDLLWEERLSQHLRSATTLGDLASRMNILLFATSNLRFEEFARLMEWFHTFPPDQWQRWKSVGKNMLLHNAYDALCDYGCTHEALRTCAAKPALA